MGKEGDMIVPLAHLPQCEPAEGIAIKRAFFGDKGAVLSFVREHFQETWVYEVEHAMTQDVSKCFLAVQDGKILGFACFDGTARGFFGPTGVLESERGKNIGAALLVRTLEAMREYGYAYGIIGWVSDAEPFYRKVVGAEYIPNGEPQNSIYSNMI